MVDPCTTYFTNHRHQLLRFRIVGKQTQYIALRSPPLTLRHSLDTLFSSRLQNYYLFQFFVLSVLDTLLLHAAFSNIYFQHIIISRLSHVYVQL